MGHVIDQWNAKPPKRIGPWPDARPKLEEPQWPVSDIWPFNILPCGGLKADAGWRFEPSAYINKKSVKADEEFERQKEAFKNIGPIFLMPYRGLFVASRDGVIVDSDADLPSLTNRFFSQHGDVPVFITRVGGRQRVLLRTPRTR